MSAIDIKPDPGPSGSPVPGSLPPAQRRFGGRRSKLALLALLVVATAAVVGMVILRLIGAGSVDLPGLGRRPDVPGYSFSMYGVGRPLGVAVSSSGDRVFVTESGGKRLVRVFNRSGKEIDTLAPPRGNGIGHLPVYVAVDPATDDIYISDRIQQTVYVYDRDGGYRREFVPSNEALGATWQPLALAFDDESRLYVSDVSRRIHRVMVFRRDGTLLRSFDNAGPLSFPNAIAVDRQGRVYISDSNNGRLVIFDRAGRLVGAITRGAGAGDLGLPRGMAIDARGRLYIVDTTGQAVQVYQLQDGPALPKYVGSFGREGQDDGSFEYPNGAAANGSRVYVTDRENNRVQVWTY